MGTTDHPSSTAWIEQTLFGGGYRTVTLEFTLHFEGTSDDVYVGALLYDTVSRDWIGARTPLALMSLRDPERLVAFLRDRVAHVATLLEPF